MLLSPLVRLLTQYNGFGAGGILLSANAKGYLLNLPTALEKVLYILSDMLAGYYGCAFSF